MIIGFIGLHNSGKSTIFSALTDIESDISPFPSQLSEPHLGVVEVEDERINKLAEIYHPSKTIKATVEFMDFAGLGEDQNNKAVFPAPALAKIKTADALAFVIRNFQDPILNDSLGQPSPVKDIENILSELIISDLIITENRLGKISLSKKRGIKEQSLVLEEQTLLKIQEQLNTNKPIRELGLTADEEKSVRGFQFLTLKPAFIILNSDENNYGQNKSMIVKLESDHKIIEFAGKFELELNNLIPEDRKIFMEDIGIIESAKDRLIHFSYSILGYISFFTVGSDEVRAWTLSDGQTALEAAGKIHTDLQRGFIRAECFNYDQLIEFGSEKELKHHGLFRLEGKNYQVRDGDILTIRFNI